MYTTVHNIGLSVWGCGSDVYNCTQHWSVSVSVWVGYIQLYTTLVYHCECVGRMYTTVHNIGLSVWGCGSGVHSCVCIQSVSYQLCAFPVSVGWISPDDGIDRLCHERPVYPQQGMTGCIHVCERCTLWLWWGPQTASLDLTGHSSEWSSLPVPHADINGLTNGQNTDYSDLISIPRNSS